MFAPKTAVDWATAGYGDLTQCIVSANISAAHYHDKCESPARFWEKFNTICWNQKPNPAICCLPSGAYPSSGKKGGDDSPATCSAFRLSAADMKTQYGIDLNDYPNTVSIAKGG